MIKIKLSGPARLHLRQVLARQQMGFDAQCVLMPVRSAVRFNEAEEKDVEFQEVGAGFLVNPALLRELPPKKVELESEQGRMLRQIFDSYDRFTADEVETLGELRTAVKAVK